MFLWLSTASGLELGFSGSFDACEESFMVTDSKFLGLCHSTEIPTPWNFFGFL